jgi:RND family efflux transporter MFP subunit
MKQRRGQVRVKWIVLAAVVAGGAVAAVAAFRYARPTVTVTEAVEGPAVQAFYATGTLEPADREHPLRAAGDGFVTNPSKTAAYVDKGDRVTKGQLLAVVFDENLQHTYDKAMADVAEKRVRADDVASPVLQEYDANVAAFSDLVAAAMREFKRYSAAMEAKAANQADFDRALDRLKEVESKLASFKAQKIQSKLKMDRELSEAESTLKIAAYRLEQVKVVSPIDGYVLDKPLPVGSRVGVNDLIVTVADTSPGNLVMRAQVDEEDVTKVWQPGAKTHLQAVLRPMFGLDRLFDGWPEQRQTVRMTLYAFADVPFTGHVVKIYPKADPERRTFEVDVKLDAPSPRMQHGMTGELAFETARRDNALVVPAQAYQDGKVWTIRGGALTATDAVVGITGVERVEVVSGLKAGDQIVISPVGGLEPGSAVRVGQTMDPRTAAGLNKPKKKDIFRGGF